MARPMPSTVLHRVPELLFAWLESTQRRHRGWSNKSRRERHQIYSAEKTAQAFPGDLKFEEIDELMRLKLSELEATEVNYDATPFGYDQPGRGIYSPQNGKRLYLWVQGWLKDCKAQLTFFNDGSFGVRGIDADF